MKAQSTSKIAKNVKTAKTSVNDQVTPDETAEILRLAEQTLAGNVAGDFVELGCYRGDTSVLLGKLLQKSAPQPLTLPAQSSLDSPSQPVENHVDNPAKNSVENYQAPVPNTQNRQILTPTGCPQPKLLWIYDSFAGLPEKTREDSSGAGANFKAGELLVTKREVIEKLRKHGLKTSSGPKTFNDPTASSNSTPLATPDSAPQTTFSVIVKKAWFDDLTDGDLPAEIAFAFCDGDLYSSIKTSLRLVAPRLAKQGIIIVHDYNNPELPGSARAVDEFLKTHPNFQLKIHYTLAILTKKC